VRRLSVRRRRALSSAGNKASRTEFFHFALVGGVNGVVYYGLYLALRTFTPYLTAHAIALILAMVVSFFLNVHFTYGTRPTWRKFLLYPLGNLTSYAGLTAGLLVLVKVFHVDERIAPLLAALAVVPVTFVLLRAILVGRLGGDDQAARRRRPAASPSDAPSMHPDRSSQG